MAALYASGAVMGFTPQQVGAMSIWQMIACIDGYNASKAPPDGKPGNGPRKKYGPKDHAMTDETMDFIVERARKMNGG